MHPDISRQIAADRIADLLSQAEATRRAESARRAEAARQAETVRRAAPTERLRRNPLRRITD